MPVPVPAPSADHGLCCHVPKPDGAKAYRNPSKLSFDGVYKSAKEYGRMKTNAPPPQPMAAVANPYGAPGVVGGGLVFGGVGR